MVLADGRRLHLRLTEPGDAEALQCFVRGLSEQSSHHRFFATVHELTPRMLERFTRITDPLEFAVVALASDLAGQPIVGTGRALRGGVDRVEFAVTIADAWQNAGLGGVLLAQILDIARERGIARVEGEVLADNDRMLHLARKLGFTVSADPDEASLRRLAIELAHV